MSGNQPPVDVVDEFARVIAVIGAATGAVGLFVSYFGLDRRGQWRRRHAAIQLINGSLTELDQHVDADASPLAAPSLWTVGVATALIDIDAAVETIPYRTFRRSLKRLHTDLVAVRGMNQPNPTDVSQGKGFALSAPQRAGLRRARQELDALHKMQKKATQKGVV